MSKSKQPMSELQKILHGGGLHRKWRQVVDGKLKGIPKPQRQQDSAD